MKKLFFLFAFGLILSKGICQTSLPLSNGLLYTAAQPSIITITLSNDEFDKVFISCSNGSTEDSNENALISEMNNRINPTENNTRVLILSLNSGDKIYGYSKYGKTKYEIK